MFNLVVLSGRLTADPELKTTPNGVSVCSFSIANEVGYGESKKTTFINIVAWRQTAEFVSKYFSKGNMIGIEGAIQTRKYQDKDGNNRTIFEVVATNVQFVEPKSTSTNVLIENEGNSTPTPKADAMEQFKAQLDEINGDSPF
jgi:single-strand DNA-binding protein